MAAQVQYEPLIFDHLDQDTQLKRSRDFLKKMQSRRTVRHFSREPVSIELIENAVAAAGTAPSGANQQPWTFVVVSDPHVKEQIREAAEKEERAFYGGRASQEWLDALAKLGTDEIKTHLSDAPFLIVCFRQPFSYRMDPSSTERVKVKHYYSDESMGIAVGILLSALHLSGLATLTHTPSPMRFLSEVLNRPDNERAYVVIPVGYPAGDAVVPVINKKSLSDIMVRVGD
ncbi:MAG: nitroreductase family protein [Candidatus Promineifilaceae bacterium]|nr:nitroreductase family protein [Candidatus Promineifilaceae bacterium]